MSTAANRNRWADVAAAGSKTAVPPRPAPPAHAAAPPVAHAPAAIQQPAEAPIVPAHQVHQAPPPQQRPVPMGAPPTAHPGAPAAGALPHGMPGMAAFPGASQPAPQDEGAALWFGDLRQDVTVQTLYEILKEISQSITMIRICRDRVTRQSLGHAYVNFTTVEDAIQCMEKLQGMPILGKPVRIMRSQRNPELRKSHKGNIFIRGLDPSIDDRTLYHTFVQFGRVLSVKVVRKADQTSSGIAFVHYENEEDAAKAIATVNGKYIEDKMVTVMPYIKKELREAKDPEKSYTNVYVKLFGPRVTLESFKEYFGQFGTIVSASVEMTEDTPPVSRGFGFVAFKEHEEAVAAVQATHNVVVPGLSVDGKPLYCQRMQSKEERTRIKEENYKKRIAERAKCVNMYVKFLGEDVDDERLKETFGRYGEIVSARVMRDPTGRSLQHGFVCFRDNASAMKASEEMNGVDGVLGPKPLYMNLAQKREQRAAQHHFQAMQQSMQYGTPSPWARNYPGFMAGAGFGGAAPHGGPYAGVGQPPRGMPYGRGQYGAPGGFPGAGRFGPGMQPHMHPGAGGRVPGGVPPHAAAGAPSAEPGQLQKELLAMPLADRRPAIGEFLYPKIQQLLAARTDMPGDQANKVTGMLLELEELELFELMSSEEQLEQRVEEAVGLLKEDDQ